MRGLWIRRSALVRRSSACCVLALVLAGCGMTRDPGVRENREAPVVVRAEFREVPAPAEAVVLAHRILHRESAEFLMGAGHRRALAREIEAVLSRIRDAEPTAAAVTVRPSHTIGRLILGVEPDLLEILSGLLDDATGLVELRTGWAEFDALNARLGLSTVTLFTGPRHCRFPCRRACEYSGCGRGLCGDGRRRIRGTGLSPGRRPDIDASKTSGAWHVIIR